MAWATFSVVVAVVVVGGSYALWRINDDRPVSFESDVEHFKYGSTGGERGWKLQFGFGIPYWMWIALPELVPELMPEGPPGMGYSSLGLVYEEDRNPRFDLPIGTSMRRVQGIDRVYLNCAFCHTGSVRDTAGGPRQIVLGMPANTVNLGAFAMFLEGAAKSRKFRDREVMAKIAELEQLREKWIEEQGDNTQDRYQPAPWGFIDRMIMRWVGVMALRDQLLSFMGRLDFIDFATAGPGRVDTFNSPKALLGFDMYSDRVDPRELFGNVDFPSVWYQKARRGMKLHWDGNQCSTDERNLSAAFGTGATPATLDKEKLIRVANWLWDQARPPDFPPDRIDTRRIARGEDVYRQYCRQCHGNGHPPFREPGDGSRVGEVEPIEGIRTDRGRLDSYTPMLAANQNTLYAGFPEMGEEHCRQYQQSICDPTVPEEEFEQLRQQFLDACYPARFSHFRKTFGYANLPLDGIWLRAPYLHNGSVPDLKALLEPAAIRPVVFYTGYDVYDYDRVGFVTKPLCGEGQAQEWCVAPGSTEPDVPVGSGWRFDTTQPGNGNYGHEGPEYGTELPAEDKQALLEYLKTI
jgi:mono/diheme cytochrome c family protein